MESMTYFWTKLHFAWKPNPDHVLECFWTAYLTKVAFCFVGIHSELRTGDRVDPGGCSGPHEAGGGGGGGGASPAHQHPGHQLPTSSPAAQPTTTSHAVQETLRLASTAK